MTDAPADDAAAPAPQSKPPRRHRGPSGRQLLAVFALPLLFVVGWGVWAGAVWLRYGKGTPKTAPAYSSQLRALMPAPEVFEHHESVVNASPQTVWNAAMQFDLLQSPVVRGVFTGREWLKRERNRAPMARRPFVEEARALGWQKIAEAPGKWMMFGAITQPWEAAVLFTGMPSERLASFSEPGYAKIVWTLAVDSLGPELARLSTDTWVTTTDAESRAKFRRYWALYSPGIVLIRRETLRTIAAEAERAARVAPVRTTSAGTEEPPRQSVGG